MGYTIQAVIGPAALLTTVVAEQPGAALIGLPQGIAMMPMTDEVFDAVNAGADEGLGFWKLPAGYPGKLSAWSVAGPVGYAEAEFFGGAGGQRAALWVAGRLAWGPVSEGEGSPISLLLRKLGVTRGTHHDEFDALGLGRHRDTEDWPAR